MLEATTMYLIYILIGFYLMDRTLRVIAKMLNVNYELPFWQAIIVILFSVTLWPILIALSIGRR